MAGEFINHFGAVRLRVTGSGNLKLRFISYDDIYDQVLTPVSMSTATNRMPTVLSNFLQQQAQLEVKVTDIEEYFRIDQILIYIKPVYTSFPQ